MFGMNDNENPSQQGGSSWDVASTFGGAGPPGFDASAAPARPQAPSQIAPVSTKVTKGSPQTCQNI